MDKNDTDILILGAGCAGLTAGIYGARAGKRVVILENGAPGGQAALTARIDNYPGVPNADGFLLTQTMLRQAEDLGVTVLSCEVKQAKLTQKRVLTSDGWYSAGRVVIATGAKPKKLGIPGEERFTGRGVSYCASCDGFFYRDRTVHVVGGGNSACEEALYLAGFAKEVHLLVRRDVLRCQQAIREELERNPRIHIHFQRELTEILGGDRPEVLCVRNVQTGDIRRIPAGDTGIFIFAGYAPSTELFAGQIDLDENGYIVTDERLRTSLPGVYAAGDVRQKALRQIVTAVADGALAVQ